MLLSIHYMVKHGETLWVTMSNGLCNETHLNPVTKCHYPQAPIPNLCLASGKGELSSSATVCWDCLWSGAFCTHLPLRPPLPQPLRREQISLRRIHFGADDNSFTCPEGAEVCHPSRESHASMVFSRYPESQMMMAPPPFMGAIRGDRKYALKRILKTTKILLKTLFNGVTQEAAAKRTGLNWDDLDFI